MAKRAAKSTVKTTTAKKKTTRKKNVEKVEVVEVKKPNKLSQIFGSSGILSFFSKMGTKK